MKGKTFLMKMTGFNSRKWKYGSLATLMTIIFIVAALLLNMLFTWAVRNYSIKIDLTEQKIFELSEETKEYIKNLSGKVKIITAMPETDYDSIFYSMYSTNSSKAERLTARVRSLFENYVNLSNGNITLEYHDVYTEPELVDKYGTNDVLSDYSIIIESEKRFYVISWIELFNWVQNTSTLKYEMNGYKGEETLNSALVYVLRDELPTAVFTSGHNEAQVKEVRNLFDVNNYALEDLNLMQSEMPQSAMTLVIANPSRDFSDAEIDKIDTYLENGGNMMVFLSPNYTLPKLESYLEKWGVRVTKNRLFDESSSIAGELSTLIIKKNTDDATGFTSGISTAASSTPLAAPNVSALEILWVQKDARTVTLALKTSANAYFKGEGMTSETFEEGDTKAVFAVATVTEKTRYVKNQPITTRVIITASADMFNDDYITGSNYINAKLITNSIGMFGDNLDVGIVIEPKAENTYSITLETAAFYTFFIIFVGVIPLACVITGIVVYMRRRHL